MNYYNRHINDYRAATAHLSWDEDAAYNRLLDICYATEKPLPADISQVCRLARATKPAHRAAVETVLQEFFVLEADGWHQHRCDEELALATERARRARENGTQGGRPRKPRNNPEETHPVNSGIDPGSYARASHSPFPIPQEETEANASAKRADNGPTRTRGTRLSDDWQPDVEDRAFAEQQGLDADTIAAEFRDYWIAKPGAAGVKLDWPATWRNWCRHAQQRRGSNSGPGRGRAGNGRVSVTEAVGDVIVALRDRA